MIQLYEDSNYFDIFEPPEDSTCESVYVDFDKGKGGEFIWETGKGNL